MMATVRHVTSSSGLRKFQTDGFLFIGVYTILQRNKITHIVLHAQVTTFYSLCTKSMSVLLTDNTEIKIKELKGKVHPRTGHEGP